MDKVDPGPAGSVSPEKFPALAPLLLCNRVISFVKAFVSW